MKPLLTTFIFALLFITPYVYAQYPSDNTLIADVKAKNSAEFVTVTPTGSWKMTHDKVPEWQDPDACERVVNITGKKKADGTFWTYKAFAIYNKVGGKMTFDRLFIVEDETRLNGINLPDDSYFLNVFIEKMNARDKNFLMGNYNLRMATNFYSYALKGTPRATGTSENIYVFAIVSVEMDMPTSNTKLTRKVTDISLKFQKQGNDFVFLFGIRATNDDHFISEMDFGSQAILNSIPTFEGSTKTIQEFTSQHPNYPKAKGSNGVGFPTDAEILKTAQSTFLEKEDNFKILFGEKGMNMITLVEFKAMEGSEATSTDATHMSKTVNCDYTFFNAKDDEKSLMEYIGRRQLELQMENREGAWVISGAKFLTETEYIKQTSLSYNNYINTVKANTYAKKFGH